METVKIESEDTETAKIDAEDTDTAKKDAEDTETAKIDDENYAGPELERMDMMSRGNSLSLLRDICFEDGDKQEVHEPAYDAKNLGTPIVIVTSELSPWSKSGGLALVTASLAIEFAKRGHRTMAVVPMYDNYENARYVGCTRIHLFGGDQEVKYFHTYHEVSEGKGVDYIFVDHPCYHRAGGLYYNAQLGVEYADNLFRFSLFSLAAIEAPSLVNCGGSTFGDSCMFIANDWQSALVPVYLTHRMRPVHRYVNSRCIFIVHNFGYQGIYPCNKLVPSGQGPIPVIIKNVGVDDLCLDFTGAYEHLLYNYPPHQRSYDGDDGNVFNLTKGAILTCDRILTVSEGYAGEMKTIEGGFSLDPLVRSKEFFLAGIINGIDTVTWNPRTDPIIASNYDIDGIVEGKASCKKQLQEKCGLVVDKDLPLVSFVGRLTAQKGIDLIFDALDWLMQDTGNGITGKVQVLLMGNGDEHFVHRLHDAANRYPGRVCGMAFDPQVEHILYAGSDLLLMPSRYEPCGLPQMCAQRYGTVPIVTICGGLKDSVVIEPKELATGFGILPLDIHKFKEIMYLALETYHKDKAQFQGMQRRGFETDFSWCKRIDEYEKHIDWTLADPPFVR